MITWEYLIVALPAFEAPTRAPGVSASVEALNGEGQRGGAQGWEAVGMTVPADNTVAVLMKRPKEDRRAAGGR
jgi:hypothetical protein